MRSYSHAKCRLLRASAAFPLVWLSAFWLLALHVRLSVGSWPSYGHPDPKDAAVAVLYEAIVVGLCLMPALGLTTTACAVFSRLRSRDVPWPLVLAPVLSVAVVVVFMRCDPAGFTEWFFD